MPKNNTRHAGVVKMSPELHDAMLAQREAFRRKFGRDPGPNDPVFFDPDADTPLPISQQRIESELVEAARRSGLDPAKVKKLMRDG
jgi:hypothetical protein